MNYVRSIVLCLLAGYFTASAFQPSSSYRTFSKSSTNFPPLSAVVNIEENNARDIGSMDEWVALCGLQRCDGFQLTTEDGMDFSVMTTQPLAQGSAILYVPSAMIFSSLQVRQELEGYVEAAEEQLQKLVSEDRFAQFYLFLKLLSEYEQGDQSPFFPWLNSLPRTFYNGASMTPFCYECLPPLVGSLAMEERVTFIHFYHAAKQVTFLSDETKKNKDLARWIYNIVCTRSFGPTPQNQKIIPMADMFNHGTETEIDMGFDEEGNCHVYATKDVAAGSPLRMSYGDPTNPSHLFATYGFLDESSPATFCKIMNIPQTKELKDIGLDYSRMVFYKDTGDVSEEVWDVLLYQCLDKNTQKQFHEAHMAGDAATKAAIHQQHFKSTSMALKCHVDTFLSQLDDLSGKAVGKDIIEHPRLPLILMHNEFVKSTFLKVKAQIDPMVAQARQG